MPPNPSDPLQNNQPQSNPAPVFTPPPSWTPQVVQPVVPTMDPNAQPSGAPSLPMVESPAMPAFMTPPPAPPQAPTGFTGGMPPGMQPPPVPMAAAKPKKKKLLLVGAIVALLVVLGGGYTFAFYLPNTPGNVYKTSLSRDGKGYDKLVSYINTQQQKKYKGATGSGSLKFTSALVSGDGDFSFSTDGANTTGQVNVDVAGQKLSLNGIAVQPSGQDEPDIYLQLTGIKSLLDSEGLNSLDSLDGKWVVIDHTLVETAANSATGGTSSKGMTAPTKDQINDALAKVGTVNHQYVFSTDEAHAVLTQQKYLGKSTQGGRSVYGYQMGYNKANMKAYVNALGAALDSSSLNAWVKDTTGKTISQEVDTADIAKSIDSAKSDYTFTMYVDAQTKLINKLHFPASSDPADNYVEAALGYTGGSDYSFSVGGAAKDSGTTTALTLKLGLNTSTNKVSFAADLKVSGGADVTANVSADFAPSNKSVSVTVPTNAEPLTTLLQTPGLSDFFGGGGSDFTGTDDTQSATNDLFTLTQ